LYRQIIQPLQSVHRNDINNDNNKTTKYKTNQVLKASFMFIDDGDNDKDKKQRNLEISAIFINCKFSIVKSAANQN